MRNEGLRELLRIVVLDVHLKLAVVLVVAVWVATYQNLFWDALVSPRPPVTYMRFAYSPCWLLAGVCLFVRSARSKPHRIVAAACFVEAFQILLRGGKPNVAWQNIASTFHYFGLPLSYHFLLVFPEKIKLFRKGGIAEQLIVPNYVVASIYGAYKLSYGLTLAVAWDSSWAAFVLSKELREAFYPVTYWYQAYILLSIAVTAAAWLRRIRSSPDGNKFVEATGALIVGGAIASAYFVVGSLVLGWHYLLVMLPITALPIGIVYATFRYRILTTDDFFFNSCIFSLVLGLTGVASVSAMKGTSWVMAQLVGPGYLTDLVPVVVAATVAGPAFTVLQDPFKHRVLVGVRLGSGEG